MDKTQLHFTSSILYPDEYDIPTPPHKRQQVKGNHDDWLLKILSEPHPCQGCHKESLCARETRPDEENEGAGGRAFFRGKGCPSFENYVRCGNTTGKGTRY